MKKKMKMFKKVLITATIALGATISFATQSHAADYVENNEFNLPAGAGDSRVATPNYIILHETANPRATGRNEATYMRNNWRNAYTTHIVGDGGIVYNVGEVGYVSWGALNANPYAPAQIELQHTYNRDLFNKNYRAYVSLARNMAKRFNIPLTLDGAGRGIKSHWWVTQNFGGDHTDPYGYLAEMGISKAKLANDLANGIGGSNTNVNPTPKPQPPKHKNPLEAGAHYSVMNDGKGNAGHVDKYGQVGKDIRVAGWHIANYKYEYIIMIDRYTGKEVTRVKANGVARPDVNKVYNTYGNVGFDVKIPMSKLKGHTVIPMMRATNDPTGNTKGGFQDFYETRWYLGL